MSNSLWPHGLQHIRLPCPSLSPRDCSNSCPLSWWCHPTVSSSIARLSSYPQSFAESGSLPVSQLFASGGQSTEASASASALSVNTQGWFPLGLTSLISFQSTGLSRVFSSTVLWSSPFSMVQLSHIFFTLSDVLLSVSLSTFYWQSSKTHLEEKDLNGDVFHK